MLTAMSGARDPEIPPEIFDVIGRVLKARYGFCLEGYKDKCVRRRICIRIRATHSASAEEYSTVLTENPAEQEHLLGVLTINVSHFFRNPSTFQKLSSEILPELIRERGPGARLMSIGCAGGEEPYSLAIMLRERYPRAVSAERFSIRGTDVDLQTLDHAKRAVYHRDRLTEVTPELLARWFVPEGDRFRLKQEVTSMVDFAHADLNDEKGCGECDLILCRNVLIYFERGRQERILNGFADALKSGGMLVLGKSETLFGAVRKRFRTVCPVERIYRVV